MTTAVQHRRGTTAEHSTFTGLEGEVTIDTTKDTAVIHDGVLAGGYPLAKENLANVTTSGLSSIDGASTASDDKFFIYDQSTTTLKTITRAELNNAIEQDALANVAITGGTINGTAIGGTTAAAGAFLTLSSTGNTTLGDASGDTVTINGTANFANVNPTLTAGTANGVAYLNGSKVLTTGSALTFDGTNLGVGTSSPSQKLDVYGNVNISRDGYSFQWNNTGNTCAISASSGTMTFLASTSGYTERARITSSGYSKFSNDGTYLIGSGTTHEMRQSANDIITYFTNKNATNPYGIEIDYTAIDPNGTGNSFFAAYGTTTLRAQFRSNGGLANYSANDVNLSDRREKTNFAPAKSYLDTICAIPVQTFNYIDQSEDDPGLTLGVVAQDVQAVAPELVMESNWGTKDEPKMRLSIYQTDLQYALMKALQELKAEFDAYKASHP